MILVNAIKMTNLTLAGTSADRCCSAFFPPNFTDFRGIWWISHGGQNVPVHRGNGNELKQYSELAGGLLTPSHKSQVTS